MNTTHCLFIIEDDNKLRQILSSYFRAQNFDVVEFAEGKSAVEAIISQQPELVMLDLMLPDIDGLTICRQIRPKFLGKILILTSSGDDFDHVVALEIGADDFVTKPIKPRVLLARLRALVRNESTHIHLPESIYQSSENTLIFGGLLLNNIRKWCELSGKHIVMTDSEFDLLWLLGSSADQVLSRDDLTRAIRGIEYDGLDRTIDNKVVSLRKKLGDTSSSPYRIITVRGKGYVFVPDAWND
ncbi:MULTISPECIES: response regulator [unclassified Aliivibrio]|uniref:response regulator n=1 Tax=Aliivibrio TaxID=511678 RepID=UPI00076A2417|nr:MULTISPECIES: response regulator [unclassified Aliivibrio]OCH16739.1 DNA-binding response regulator [Aliivibrio sp. 1S165]OCH19150.1 DNA-binding response regulator [Aliivibrio sp. 1S128]OCH32809.1 DNA-binding response regulator [Aliivibrio sp. 1S175]